MNKFDSFRTYRNVSTAKSFWAAVVFVFVIIGLSQNGLAQKVGGGAILSIDEPATGTAIGASKNVRPVNNNIPVQKSGSASASKDPKSKNSKSKASAKTASAQLKPGPRGAPKTTSGVVIGDKYSFLNNEISEPVRPVFTIKAKQAGAIGLVQVEVLIDENGNVIQAHARTGNSLLHPEAEKAALETKFNKPTLNGKPAKAMGFIVFRFGRPEDDPENN